MPRFFVSKENINEEERVISILGEDAFHIARSLRMAVGDEITVADMQGREHSCRLTKIRDDACECEILSTTEGKTESPVEITLFMGYPKGDKLEVVIQKAVELGVNKIVFFESRYTVSKIDQKKAQRLNKISVEASKQCGRAVIVPVEVASIKQVASQLNGYDVALFCYEKAQDVSLSSAAGIIVGSEGGFAEEEAQLFVDSGATAVTLGKRILRAETAPLYAMAVLCDRLGEN